MWITLPVVSKACTKLVKCSCKSSRAVKENVHVRGHSGNAHAELASYVAATVKNNYIKIDI